MSTKLHTEVAKIREEIARVHDECEWLERAQVPRDELKVRAAARIRAASEKFDGGLALHQLAHPQGSSAELLTVTVPAHQGPVKEIDFTPLLGWLMGTDALIELVHAKIDAMDYRPGPPLADRPARLAELRTEMRVLDEREEATIVRAEADGIPIPRRADADPAVVLCYRPDGEMAEGIKFASAPLAPQREVNAEPPAAARGAASPAPPAPPAPAYVGNQSQRMGPSASVRSPMNIASRIRR